VRVKNQFYAADSENKKFTQCIENALDEVHVNKVLSARFCLSILIAQFEEIFQGIYFFPFPPF
jgi:hypothetical protein